MAANPFDGREGTSRVFPQIHLLQLHARTDKQELAQIIATYLKADFSVELKSVELAVGPNGGLAKDARFNMDGFRTTLQLRADFVGQAQAADPRKYLDMSFYERALRTPQ